MDTKVSSDPKYPSKDKERDPREPRHGGITNGAELVRELRKSGTGEQKLDVLREKLQAVWDTKPGTIASSDDLIDFMKTHNYFHDVTLKKATQLSRYGSLMEAEKHEPVQAIPIEEIMLGGEEMVEATPALRDAIEKMKEADVGKAKGSFGDSPGDPVDVHSKPTQLPAKKDEGFDVHKKK